MHRALAIADIVELIFRHLESDPPSLASLARVCKDFWNPACAVLWREIYGTQRFLRLLPAEYQQELQECSGWAFRIPSETDTERVRLYAAFVQELGIHPGRPPYGPANGPNPRRTMERRGLPMLMLLRPYGPAFPNLTRLQAIAETDDSLCSLSRLLTPQLQSLYIHTLQGDNFMVGHFLRAIPVNAPTLQSLEIEALGALSKESEASLLSAAKRVSKLSLQAVSPSEAFLNNLAAENKLRSLTLELTLARTSPLVQWQPGTFDMLEEFEGEALSASRTCLLLDAMSIPNLRRLRLTIGTVPKGEIPQDHDPQHPTEPASVRRIMKKIAAFTQLRILRLILPNLDDVRLTLSPAVFKPLGECANLESIVLIDRSDYEDYDSVCVAWDDTHVTALVKGWPKLHTLHLECSNTRAPTTQLTPAVLTSLAELCPDLRSLRLPLNMTSAGTVAYKIPPPSKKMSRFTLEASTVVDNEAVVADLIHAVWPDVVVTSWKTAPGPTADALSRFAEFYRARHPV